MKMLFARFRYLSLVPVLSLLVTFAFALYAGVLKSLALWRDILTGGGSPPDSLLHLLEIVDTFLVAIVIYVLAVSIYGMFIGDPGASPKLVAHNLTQLKSKLGGIIVLVLAVRFVEVVFKGALSPLELLWLALATTSVASVLIAFSWFSHAEEKEKA